MFALSNLRNEKVPEEVPVVRTARRNVMGLTKSAFLLTTPKIAVARRSGGTVLEIFELASRIQ